MALVLKDRVKVVTTTTGTGTLALGAAVSGFQDFSVIGNGNTTYYTITDVATGDWEVGIGTYSSTGPTLSRDTVLESSNSGALVPFGVGDKNVFVTYPAEKSVNLDATGNVSPLGTVSSGAWQGTTVGIGYGGTGQTTASAAFNALSPITTTGDLIVGNGTNSATRLGIGAAGTFLSSDGTTASWGSISGTYSRTNVTATAGQTTFSAVYSVGYIQVYVNGVLLDPADYTASNGTTVVLTSAAAAGDIVTLLAFNVFNIANTVTSVSGTSPVVSSGGATPLISLASAYGDAQNPYASKAANYVLASPNGSSGAPTFRSLVADDLPTVPVASGGTGATSLTANNVILGNGTSAVQFVAPGASGSVLTSNGTTWTSVAATSGSLLKVTSFTSSATWTKGAGTKYVLVYAVGGGGGGYGTPGGGIGCAGGGGGCAIRFLDVSAIATVSVTVGSGGSASNSTPTAGGNSTFGTYATGGGGGASAALSNTAAAGTASNGTININGQTGSAGSIGGLGGSSLFGFGGNGATSVPGVGNYGVAGTGYGGGGSGGWSGTGGAGSGGIVIVYEYA